MVSLNIPVTAENITSQLPTVAVEVTIYISLLILPLFHIKTQSTSTMKENLNVGFQCLFSFLKSNHQYPMLPLPHKRFCFDVYHCIKLLQTVQPIVSLFTVSRSLAQLQMYNVVNNTIVSTIHFKNVSHQTIQEEINTKVSESPLPIISDMPKVTYVH